MFDNSKTCTGCRNDHIIKSNSGVFQIFNGPATGNPAVFMCNVAFNKIPRRQRLFQEEPGTVRIYKGEGAYRHQCYVLQSVLAKYLPKVEAQLQGSR